MRRSARIVQRVKPSSFRIGFVTGLSVNSSDAARKPEGRDAFRARDASSVRSEASAYKVENSICMVRVSLVPAAPAGGSYTSERIWEVVRESSKRISPAPSSSASCARASLSNFSINAFWARSRSASLACTDGVSLPPVNGAGLETDSERPSLPSTTTIVSASTLPARPLSTASTGSSRVSSNPAGTSPARIVSKRILSTVRTTVPSGIVTACCVRLRNVTRPRASDWGITPCPVTITVCVPSTITRLSRAGMLPVMNTDSTEGPAITGNTTLWVFD